MSGVCRKKGSVKTKEQIDAANQFESYRKGWQAGAAFRAMDPVFEATDQPRLRDAYNLGYGDGQAARAAALSAAQTRYGHVVGIVRLQTGGGESG